MRFQNLHDLTGHHPLSSPPACEHRLPIRYAARGTRKDG